MSVKDVKENCSLPAGHVEVPSQELHNVRPRRGGWESPTGAPATTPQHTPRSAALRPSQEQGGHKRARQKPGELLDYTINCQIISKNTFRESK